MVREECRQGGRHVTCMLCACDMVREVSTGVCDIHDHGGDAGREVCM